MLNKLFKTTHNRYLKFIYFLRYLFLLFFISISLFLIIPNFFNYEKKIPIIINYLGQNYNYDLNKYEIIKFKSLPLPHLEIKNVIINFNTFDKKLRVGNLKIFPKLFSIYNYENFQIKKIILRDNNIDLESSELFLFINKFLTGKNKVSLDHLNLNVLNGNNTIINLKNIKFTNYGYNKNLINGEIFGKKFKVNINDGLKFINFKLINSGVSSDITIDKNLNKNLIGGLVKSKILNNHLKFNFNYNKKNLNIFNLNFRNKNISFENNSKIILSPFLDVRSEFKIESLNAKKFKYIDINQLLKFKDFTKKINSKNEIIFSSKKFSRSVVDEFYLAFDTAYGRVNYNKKISIGKNLFDCKGNINLLEDYPILFFDCLLVTNDVNSLLKEFSIKAKKKNEVLEINAIGNFNILNKKINLKTILVNNTKKILSEDLKFYKDNFESIFFSESFLEMFNLKKIKRFILEIS